ncbi:MAG: lipopolysaccharide heptosyltransferase II [Candidatus Omnitrophica bacterium]|nr:lipopolysaccharide heptosyltransferase II [Candidatus Omnitrophota bacterium]
MIERILITRTDRIGDVVLSTPVFSALRKRYPKAYIAALIASSNRHLLEGNPNLDEVILYDKGRRHKSWLSTCRFARALRTRRFDVVVNLHANNRVHWISFLAGIPMRIGYRKRNAFLLTHTLPDEKWKGRRHESEYNFDLLRFLDIPLPSQMDLHLPLQHSSLEKLQAVLENENFSLDKPYIVIHPSASCPSRLWRAERYAKVGDILSKQWGVRVILVAGSGSDSIFTDRVLSFMRSNPLNLAGKLSLGMLAWLLKESRLFISNDSGPMHMAAALNVHLVAIFGRNKPGLGPKRWKPLGMNSSYIQKDVGCIECAAHRCNLGFLCLDEVKVEDVLREIERHVECFAC